MEAEGVEWRMKGVGTPRSPQSACAQSGQDNFVSQRLSAKLGSTDSDSRGLCSFTNDFFENRSRPSIGTALISERSDARRACTSIEIAPIPRDAVLEERFRASFEMASVPQELDARRYRARTGTASIHSDLVLMSGPVRALS